MTIRALRILAASLALAGMLAGTGAKAQISVVGVSTTPAPVSAPVTSVTINAVAGTAAGDTLVALVAVRGGTGVKIATPAGWTLVQPIDSRSRVAQAVYRRTATASEPALHTWTFSPANRAAVALIALRGVDTADPVAAVASRATTSSSVSFIAPSISPPVANTLLVALYSADFGAGSWTPPAGMTERVDLGTGAAAAGAGIRISLHTEPRAASGATGTRTATFSSARRGAGTLLALRPSAAPPPPPPPPSSFNAFEPATPAGSITGVIQTRQAALAFSLAIVAIHGGAVHTAFTGNVTVELLDASDNSGALGPNHCRTSWTAIAGSAQTVTFTTADQGRRNASFSHAEAWRDLRLRMTHTLAGGGAPVVACSSDNFAIRPAAFLVTATDGDRRSPGTARTLDNAALGGVVHNAGRPFTLTVRAVNANGAVTTQYTLAPVATVTPCTGATCPATVGTLGYSGTAVAGVLVANDASYSEVGSFSLAMTDSAFAAVDAADTPLAARTITSSAPLTVGRFVPDRFAVTLNTPQFAAGCPAGAFTYVGQPFGYAAGAQPVVTVRALNAAGALTANYTGALWRVSNATLANRAYSAATGTLDTAGLPPPAADPVIADGGGGTGTLTFSSGSGLLFQRGTPVAPFHAEISLAIDLADADGVLYANDAGVSLNPVRFGAATAGAGIAFTGGRQMYFGRLRLPNANGPEILALPMRISAEYWNGSAFVTNFADRCTTLAASHVLLGNWQRNLNPGETAPTDLGTLASGSLLMRLSAPGSGNDGSVDVTLALGPGAANLPWLRGAWTGATWTENPTARATFGAAGGSPAILFRRENF
jgi:MSHA biogenesis protein MshQ